MPLFEKVGTTFKIKVVTGIKFWKFWKLMLYSLVEIYQYFDAVSFLHLWGRRVTQACKRAACNKFVAPLLAHSAYSCNFQIWVLRYNVKVLSTASTSPEIINSAMNKWIPCPVCTLSDNNSGLPGLFFFFWQIHLTFDIWNAWHVNTQANCLFYFNIFFSLLVWGVHHSIVGWGTMLQAGRSQDWVPMRWIFSIYLNLPATLWPWGWLSL
jgi:hypothetical protein